MAYLAAHMALGLGAASSAQAQPALYVNPHSTTFAAAERLDGEARRDALALGRIPTATWFSDGTPAEVERQVASLVDAAAAGNALPVLVAYNIPARDCALYSAGGAAGSDAYRAWIEGFAAGIGERAAIVVLEPDSLGAIPWHRTLDGELEHCQPGSSADSDAAATRFAQLSAAVDILAALPNVRIYLDGTGSGWLAPGEAADRLIRANVARADGYFLNVSNFESDLRLLHYARWISDCLALVTGGETDPRACPSQYHPADFADSSSWTATDAAYDALFARVGIAREPASQKHAIIDTSRNGTGSWDPPANTYSDAEIWCNPPGRGLGRRPALDTGNPYVDAYLWIKIPGESDGECYRGTGGPTDPARGIAAPRAGGWFPAQARELIRNAVPPLIRD
ncbi:glycoside hydrolase family 6 protein [Croceicoccus sp. YJ47]|uniref:glycoside hydrolase family 6 protein n=1 Tax=Croceicoccus sp. YJ47 TaxID=2798724 RepID=UPI001F43FD12|nr:glycoside hydrolase family 6 protein [Croceicoccus sp. YJ47]